jgi:hypothetical protein
MEGQVTSYSGTTLSINVDLTGAMSSTPLPPVLFNYLGGLTLSNDTTTPATVLNIATGNATSDDNTTSMTLATAGFKKNCNAAWAVGSGNGALDSGSAFVAGSWYHVFLIERVDTYVVDVLISASATSPILPANYTKKRRIWTISIDATPKIVPFVQLGDECLWVTPISNYNNVSWSATTILHTTSVPPGVKVIGLYQVYLAPSATCWFLLTSPDASGNSPNVPNGNITAWVAGGSGGATEVRIRTNTNQQIQFSASGAGTGYSLITRGWLDSRGK